MVWDLDTLKKLNDAATGIDPALKPCPFCGSENVPIFEQDHEVWTWVACNQCGAEGPIDDDPDKAIQLWNQRPKPENPFHAGDRVKHLPTDETWTLAVDQFENQVSPCGWPQTIAKAKDCQLIQKANIITRAKYLQKSAAITDPADIRRIQAQIQVEDSST